MSIVRTLVATAIFVLTPVVTSASSTLDMQLREQLESLQNGDPDVSLAEVMVLRDKIEVRDFFVRSGFSEKDALLLAEERRAIYEQCLPVMEETEGSTIASMVEIILASDYCENISDSAIGFIREEQ